MGGWGEKIGFAVFAVLIAVHGHGHGEHGLVRVHVRIRRLLLATSIPLLITLERMNEVQAQMFRVLLHVDPEHDSPVFTSRLAQHDWVVAITASASFVFAPWTKYLLGAPRRPRRPRGSCNRGNATFRSHLPRSRGTTWSSGRLSCAGGAASKTTSRLAPCAPPPFSPS